MRYLKQFRIVPSLFYKSVSISEKPSLANQNAIIVLL